MSKTVIRLRSFSFSSPFIFQFRRSNQTRATEYYQELSGIQQRVREGPTLLERQEVLIRKQSIERRYEKVLKSAGLKPSKYRAKSAPAVEETEAEIDEFYLSPVAEKASSASSGSSMKTKTVSEKAASIIEEVCRYPESM